MGSNPDTTMKLIDDLTNEEILKIAAILGGTDHLSENSRIYQVRELLKGLHHKQTNIPGIRWMRVAKFLDSISVMYDVS